MFPIDRRRFLQNGRYLAVANEAYHFSLHRIEGHQRFHIALSDAGRVVDVCTTSKRSRMKTAKVDS